MKKGAGKKTPRWYLYLVLIYAAIGLLDVFILKNTLKLVPYFTILGVAWLILNAGLLLYLKKGFEKKALLLPIYYIGFFFLAFFLLSSIKTLDFAINLQFFSSCAEILMVIFLLKK